MNVLNMQSENCHQNLDFNPVQPHLAARVAARDSPAGDSRRTDVAKQG